MFRVFDNERKEWIKKNVYLSPNGDLFLIKQSLFGMVKVPLALDSERYICHQDIGLYDKEQTLIYEGDYLKAKVAEDKEVIGMVCYAYELSGYVILCSDSYEYYTLGSNVVSETLIIGNVFDGYEE